MPGTSIKIVITQQDGTVLGQYVLGEGEYVIGREIDSAIYISNQHISRSHALLIISEDLVEVEDLGSRAGTFLDGMTVQGRTPILPGQKLWVYDLGIDIDRIANPLKADSEQEVHYPMTQGTHLGAGRFTLNRELGKGGMGAVWLAWDEEVQEEVALKLVLGQRGLSPESLEDLQREVNKSHNLDHPNIVQMGYFWNEPEEPAFISLEYVEGTDLDQLRSKSPSELLLWNQVRQYMMQLCDALDYAHSQKVAHRDIKPSNFLINQKGNLKLADFGIAASLTESFGTRPLGNVSPSIQPGSQQFDINSLTIATAGVLGSGTPPFMSPQQLEGAPPKVTDDIYSVGATFYELLTSRPPFYQGNIAEDVLYTPATPIRERLQELGLHNDLPENVEAMIMACLNKEPASRPQSANEIREWIKTSAAISTFHKKVVVRSMHRSGDTMATPPPPVPKPSDPKSEFAELDAVYARPIPVDGMQELDEMFGSQDNIFRTSVSPWIYCIIMAGFTLGIIGLDNHPNAPSFMELAVGCGGMFVLMNATLILSLWICMPRDRLPFEGNFSSIMWTCIIFNLMIGSVGFGSIMFLGTLVAPMLMLITFFVAARKFFDCERKQTFLIGAFNTTLIVSTLLLARTLT